MMPGSDGSAGKLLYCITEDWFFCSHFLERAIAARDEGYEVVVATRDARHGEIIRKAGLGLTPISFDRSGTNPLTDLGTLLALRRIYLDERPDIVHHIALKPILYGSMAARSCGVPAIVNAPVGLGHLFTSESRSTLLLRTGAQMALKGLLNTKDSRVVFENNEDRDYALRAGMAREADCVVIPGAGVNTETFDYFPEPAEPPIITLVARMLWYKGVGDFVAAARLLRTAGIKAKFQIAGSPDPGNPASISIAQLQAWHDEGAVEWLGHCDDVAGLLKASHIYCLPTYYREGLPKSILEALASGRAVVTCDIVGCREAIQHERTGLLVPPRDPAALCESLMRLIVDGDLRRQLGAAGRARAVAEYSSQRIIEDTLALYRTIAPGRGTASTRKTATRSTTQ